MRDGCLVQNVIDAFYYVERYGTYSMCVTQPTQIIEKTAC